MTPTPVKYPSRVHLRWTQKLSKEQLKQVFEYSISYFWWDFGCFRRMFCDDRLRQTHLSFCDTTWTELEWFLQLQNLKSNQGAAQGSDVQERKIVKNELHIKLSRQTYDSAARLIIPRRLMLDTSDRVSNFCWTKNIKFAATKNCLSNRTRAGYVYKSGDRS